MRPLRARVTMVGHDSLCLFSAPELFLCSSSCDVTRRGCLNMTTARETSKTASLSAKKKNGSTPRPPSSPCFGVLDMGHLESIRSASRHI